jgi:hypothetical protein
MQRLPDPEIPTRYTLADPALGARTDGNQFLKIDRILAAELLQLAYRRWSSAAQSMDGHGTCPVPSLICRVRLRCITQVIGMNHMA